MKVKNQHFLWFKKLPWQQSSNFYKDIDLQASIHYLKIKNQAKESFIKYQFNYHFKKTSLTQFTALAYNVTLWLKSPKQASQHFLLIS